MKLMWRFIKESDALWVRVLHNKYAWGEELVNFQPKGTDSAQWKGLMSVKEQTLKGLRHNLCNGRGTLFWHDQWVESGEILAEVVSMENWIDSSQMVVADVVDDRGQWGADFIQLLPVEVRQRLWSTLPPDKNKQGEDVMSWKGTANGKFSMSSAHELVCNSNSTRDSAWRSIWQTQVPERIRAFLWLVKHEALMTNTKRLKLKLLDNGRCPMCENQEETMIHLLRDCPMVSCIWQAIILPTWYGEFFNNQFQEWLLEGFSKNFGKEEEQKWYSTFAVTMWFLWKRRNQRVFEQEENHREDPVRTIQRFVADNAIAIQLGRNTMQQGRDHSFSEWRAPPSGWFKLNSDGAVCQGINKAAMGGLIRDDKGHWIRGFSKYLGVCSSVSAELWGILEGLLLAKSLNIDKLEVECDAAEIIQAIEEELDATVMTNSNQLVAEIARVVKLNWTVVFSVVSRQANKCADFLAKEALSHIPELRIIHSPERDVQSLYFADSKM